MFHPLAPAASCDTKAAVDDLDLIDPDFRLSARVTRVKVRMAVVVEVHCDRDPVEPADRRLAMLALPLDHQRRSLPSPATGAAETPELPSRALVMMDQLVEFERVNLSGVQACKPIAHMLEKEPKLVAVVLADQLARRTATSSLAFDIADPHTVGHARNLPLRGAATISTFRRNMA
ncbi:MAG TPA: hypothetical protein VFI54_25920 [Solirubrobacteraceae bacterium]|nr:hypothetical protein [Solirubrobacteraceae bacterium]